LEEKKMKSQRLLWMLTGMLAIGALLIWGTTSPGNAGKPATSSQTAQSIMVKLTGGGTYTFTDVNTYRFDKTAAATYFTNAWDGVVPTPTSQTSGGNGCVPPAPATPPPAPAPDDTQLMGPSTQGKDGIVGKNACNFLDGTPLTGTSYPQDATTTTSCTYTKNNQTHTITTTWTYTYNYNISPTGTPPVGVATDVWPLVDTHGADTADVSLAANIAGESVVVSKQFPTGKYSFSLFDASEANRVANLRLVITDAFGNVSYDSSLVDYPLATGGIPSTIAVNYPNIDPTTGKPTLDFYYTANAGTNLGTAGSYLMNGDAIFDILNKDCFDGNNYGGSDGSACSLATMNMVVVPFGPGNYTVTLTGVVKGNDATMDEAFSVSQNIIVVTQGCGGGPAQ
jgi:hypothetical protein